MEDTKLMREIMRRYEYRDGMLYYKVNICNHKKGTVVGSLRNDGYWATRIFCKHYAIHRIIFFMMNGFFPIQVDHKDQDKTNNRIDNLRACSNSENQINTVARGGSSKFKGVAWRKNENKWHAHVSHKHTNYHLGYFDIEEEAARAYDQAALYLYGDFVVKNFSDSIADDSRLHKAFSRGTSRFRGVSLVKASGKYKVEIWYNGKQRSFGRFNTQVEAAKHHDVKIRELGANLNRLNFPD